MNSIKIIARRLFLGLTVSALIVGSLPKEVKAQIVGNGGTTGWNPVSSTSEPSCLQKGIKRMNILVDQGDIQTLPNGNSWRFRKGNNVIFTVFCTKSGDHVRVDVICFNACEPDIFRLRGTIDALMQW
ncbi:MAG: hypothetical protein F6K10_03780 [Moorea sp. SIO2B7]|nr:hypothetical protein [Moorena sp. SIO2B7]